MPEETESNFEIILGTYEEFTLGYKFSCKDKKCNLVQSFATHDHSGSVRTISCEGRYAATGGSDDRAIIYDMLTRREQSVLTHHNGTVNSVVFTPDGTHLITASDDGVLAAVRCGNWQVEKVWSKAHGGTPIKFIAVHPSGKLALTLGNDITLRTWNLVKGRQAYVVRLQPHMRSADTVAWSSDEKSFIIFSQKYLEIWSIEQGGCLMKTERKLLISSVQWIGADHVAVGHEDGSFVILNRSLNVIVEESIHKVRIKSISCFKSKWIITADSSGKIIVWKWRKNKLIKKCDANAGCRITCMTIVKPITLAKNGLKNENVEEIVENEEKNSDLDDIDENTSKKRKSTAYIVEEHDDDEEDQMVKKKTKTSQKEKVRKGKRKKNKT